MQGDVVIGPAGDDPSILEGVTRVEGSIRIAGTGLADLVFMACVQEVVGDLVIEDNDALIDLQGLYSLSEIGGSFVFDGNDAVVSFDGAPNLQQAGSLVVRQNAELWQIAGFSSLVAIGGSLDMNGNLVGGDLTIQDNPSLVSIEGLTQLLVVNGVLTVTGNPSLCMSSVGCVVAGIGQPSEPPDEWSVEGNDACCRGPPRRECRPPRFRVADRRPRDGLVWR